MTLERKDVRAKLNADVHKALSVLCEVDGVDIGEFVERELVRVVRQRIHDAQVIADRTQRLGISGNRRERSGESGKSRDSTGNGSPG